MKDALKNALAHEKALAQVVDEARSDILDAVGGQHSKIRPVDGHPNIGVISSKNLSSESWSPDYYLPNAQKRLVSEELNSAKTATSLVDKAKAMADTGKTRNGRLNPQTRRILADHVTE